MHVYAENLTGIARHNSSQFQFDLSLKISNRRNKKAVLSQGEPRDAAVNFDTYRI